LVIPSKVVREARAISVSHPYIIQEKKKMTTSLALSLWHRGEALVVFGHSLEQSSTCYTRPWKHALIKPETQKSDCGFTWMQPAGVIQLPRNFDKKS
jgi:hypothetical protein